jgi:hypothetical protein
MYIYIHIYIYTDSLLQSVKGRDNLQYENDKVSVTHTVSSDQKQIGVLRKVFKKLEIIIIYACIIIFIYNTWSFIFEA